MDSRMKWFQAAWADKFPDMTLVEFSSSLGLEISAFQKFIATGQGLPAFTVNVIHGLLGASLEEFVDRGRLLSEADQPAPGPSAAKSGGQTIDDLLAKARAVLESGGEGAVTLRTMINLLKP